MIKHTFIENQSIIDIALMYYGNIDGVFDILKNNPDINLDNINVGSLVNVNPDTTNDYVKYFQKNKTEIATAGNIIIEN